MSRPLTGAIGAWQRAPARMAVLFAGPVAIAIGAWIYLAVMITDMAKMPGMSAMMMNLQPFAPVQLFGLFAMWAVMMAAMMLPTAAPMIMAYARMQSLDRTRGVGWWPVLAFSGGYLLAWIGFSLVAAVSQAWLISLSVMSPMMMKIATGPLAGFVLVTAGAYQFTALKQSCLRQCQSPTAFLMTQWREGSWGALKMGGKHGLFCVGCCWPVMGLLFVTGVMSAAWIVAITAYVLVEKTVPHGRAFSQLIGICIGGTGLWILV